jgi:hypothetical protein
MELLGEVGHVESHFDPFRDSVTIGAWFSPNVQQARKSFWTQTMELLGDVGHAKSHFSPFGDFVSFGPFGDSANLDAR